MLNVEKYKDEIQEMVRNNKCFSVHKDTKEIGLCMYTDCDNCLFQDNIPCAYGSLRWLFKEHKERIKLTKFEYGFLKNLDDEWKYIVKDNCGILYLYTQKPIKKIRYWTTSGFGLELRVGIFKTNIFEFIKWEDEEPYCIKDILENCEVEDNE